MFKVSHTVKCKGTKEMVWNLWSDPTTWSKWDHGLEYCKLKEGEQFQVGGKAELMPRGAPQPVEIQIVECNEPDSFTDTTTFDLGKLTAAHSVEESSEGTIEVTHTITFEPAHEKAKEIFGQHMWPHLESGLPESVKSLCALVEEGMLAEAR